MSVAFCHRFRCHTDASLSSLVQSFGTLLLYCVSFALWAVWMTKCPTEPSSDDNLYLMPAKYAEHNRSRLQKHQSAGIYLSQSAHRQSAKEVGKKERKSNYGPAIKSKLDAYTTPTSNAIDDDGWAENFLRSIVRAVVFSSVTAAAQKRRCTQSHDIHFN